jgi:hypothetical protein
MDRRFGANKRRRVLRQRFSCRLNKP